MIISVLYCKSPISCWSSQLQRNGFYLRRPKRKTWNQDVLNFLLQNDKIKTYITLSTDFVIIIPDCNITWAKYHFTIIQFSKNGALLNVKKTAGFSYPVLFAQVRLSYLLTTPSVNFGSTNNCFFFLLMIYIRFGALVFAFVNVNFPRLSR